MNTMKKMDTMNKHNKRVRTVLAAALTFTILFQSACAFSGAPDEEGESRQGSTSAEDTNGSSDFEDTGSTSDATGIESSDTDSGVSETSQISVTPFEYASKTVEAMSTAELAGQLLLSRCPESGAVGQIKEYHIAGFVLFGRDFKNGTPTSVKEDIESYQASADIPLLIAVDEEGGSVCRVSNYRQYRSSRFMSPGELYKQGGLGLILSDSDEKCALLLSLGINVNLAPVCDVSTDRNDFMYNRTLGLDASATSAYIGAVVENYIVNGVGCVLKHFPGYGSNSDTHTGIVYDKRPYSTFTESDFLPFEAGIKAGAGAVMVCHNIVECMDGERPASLSYEVHRILRQTLGFDGVIMTDDLSMDAITDYTSGEEAAVAAILAGNDLLCVTDTETQYTALLNALESGKISRERAEESAVRVLLWKISLGLMEY